MVGIASGTGESFASHQPPFFGPHRAPVFFLSRSITFHYPRSAHRDANWLKRKEKKAAEGRGMMGMIQRQRKAL